MPLRWTEPKPVRVLDLDIENRPLSYWYDGATTAEITAIAAGWMDEKKVTLWLLGRDSPEEILRGFSRLWAEAGMVTAHNVRNHDLSIIQGALAEKQLSLLRPKLAQDTLKDIPRFKDLSRSQENLCEMLGIPVPKEHMSQVAWREANRLTDEGLRKTAKRVIKDVEQHRLLYRKLFDLGWLGAPKLWRG